MKKLNILVCIAALLFGSLLFSFQRTPVQQYQVVGVWKNDNYDFTFYEWDDELKRTIKIRGSEQELKYLNAKGLRVVATYSMTTGGGWKDRIYFIVE